MAESSTSVEATAISSELAGDFRDAATEFPWLRHGVAHLVAEADWVWRLSLRQMSDVLARLIETPGTFIQPASTSFLTVAGVSVIGSYFDVRATASVEELSQAVDAFCRLAACAAVDANLPEGPPVSNRNPRPCADRLLEVLYERSNCPERPLRDIPTGAYQRSAANGWGRLLGGRSPFAVATDLLSPRAQIADPGLAADLNGPRVECTHSSDFRSVCWYGTNYDFTPMQSACIKLLWEGWERGTPAIGEPTILENAESGLKRLVHVFKHGKHPAWGNMLVRGASKGTFRLADPR